MLSIEKWRRAETQKKRETWLNDPVLYARERLGIELWEGQQKVARAIAKNRIVVCYTANGIGKSTLNACLAIWWLDMHRQSDTVTFVTGSSWHAVENVLCPQINRYIKANEVFPEGRIGITSLSLPSGGRLVSRSTNDPEGTAGLHAEYLLTLVDEGSGMEQRIVDALFGNATGEQNKILVTGNPLAPIGAFYELSKSTDYVVITISALDHPNVISGEEQIKGAVTRQSIEDKAKRWCIKCRPNETSAVHLWWLGDEGWYIPDARFISRVMGSFPEDAGDKTVIPTSLVEAASRRTMDDLVPTAIGVDVAMSPNGDETVITLANQSGIIRQYATVGQQASETVGRIIALKREHNIENPVAIDADGMGAPFVSLLRDADIEVIPIHNNGSPDDEERFANIKAELYYKFAEMLQSGFAIPNDERLKNQAKTVQRRDYNSMGQIRIEDKVAYKKRTGQSPDRFESACYAIHALIMGGDTGLSAYINNGREENEGFSFYQDRNPIEDFGIRGTY